MLFSKLIRDEAGQDLAEYAVAMTILSMGIIFSVYAIKQNLRTIWDFASNALR